MRQIWLPNIDVEWADLVGFSSSFSVMDLSDSVSLPKAIQDAKPELIAAVSPLPPLPFQPLEIGYLNVASLEETTDCPKEEQTALPSWLCLRLQEMGSSET